MIDYSLAFCYGIVVSVDTMEEIKEVLTDEEYDEMMDNCQYYYTFSIFHHPYHSTRNIIFYTFYILHRIR